MSVAVIFGGSGFIGCHFTEYLITKAGFNKVYLCDLVEPNFKRFGQSVIDVCDTDAVSFIECDVRQKIALDINDAVSLIANLAAVHREPGHEQCEYYETNLLGAEKVCAWADSVNCKNIIFTSSIAPYGVAESETNEASLTVPFTAYGGSKLVAEKIHQAWQAADTDNRRLVIVRPGVVFGPGEGGNVTRLVKAVLKRYFFYMGNKQTRKAGTYVKELCNAMWCVLQERCDTGTALFNMSLNPGADCTRLC